VARRGRRVALCPEARERVAASRRAIDAIAAAGDLAPAVYGVNTGFGALAETRIHEGDVRALQRNLVRSHACGVGPDLGQAEVRAMMVLRAQVIALGYSGVRAEIIDALVAMLNAGVYPRIPSQARSAPPAIWRRSRTWPWRSSARARPPSPAGCSPPPRRSPPRASPRSSSRPRRA